ncbi:DUF2096 family protein [Methanopyrus sp. SNP6]|uniref:DUF2096 family protein n=1 Tax=Methanopyrus sp. SNP6 TaxID=1937005 RepID=UPI001F332CEB|nr:DUF2096 family protein [Methanopyrus sp. SNP6]
MNEVVSELRARGEEVPREVLENLRTARVVLHHYEFDPHTSAKTLGKAHKYLDRAQRALARICESHPDLLDKLVKWPKRVKELAAKFREDTARSKFEPMPNRPVFRAGDGFARVKLPEPIEVERLQDVCEFAGVIVEVKEVDVVEISGDRDRVGTALKELRELPESWKKMLEKRKSNE